MPYACLSVPAAPFTLEFTVPQVCVQFWWTYNMGELLWKTQSKSRSKCYIHDYKQRRGDADMSRRLGFIPPEFASNIEHIKKAWCSKKCKQSIISYPSYSC